jgi:hypothetical protein
VPPVVATHTAFKERERCSGVFAVRFY